MVLTPTDLQSKLILVISPAPESLVETIQGAFGWQVKAMRRLPARVDRVCDLGPQVVLLDSGLPRDGALSLCKAIRAHAPCRHIGLLVSGLNGSASAQSFLDAGADELLFETATPDEVIARIHLVERRTALAQQHASEVHAAATLRERFTTLTEHLFRNIGHELYTPFLFIKSSYVLMRKQLGEMDQADWQGDSGFQSIGRMEEVIEDMRQVALATKPKNRNMYTFGSLLDGVLRQRSRRWSADNSIERIRYSIPPNLPILYGDFNGVSQILLQFIDNALKFSPEDTVVEILTRPADDALWVGIRDHGIGIAADELHRIFDLGWQSDSSDQRRYDGAGIGLALAQMLADSMGLQIGVESTPGIGSIFSIRLPIFQGDGLPGAPARAADSRQTRPP